LKVAFSKKNVIAMGDLVGQEKVLTNDEMAAAISELRQDVCA
jgi:hypothetical protein